MQFRSLIPALFLLFAVAVVSGPAAAQPGAEGPPGLFKGAGEASPQAMNAVGQKRMATLKQDSTTQSIRLVRIAGNLSQQRTLVMHVGANRALAPEVPPAFQREHPGRGGAEKPGRGRGRQKTKLFIRRNEVNAIDEGTYAWNGTVHLRSPGKGGGKRPVGTVTLVHGADGDITGTIRVESEYYLVRPLDNGMHALVEEDESTYSIGSASPRNYGGSSSKNFQSSLNAESTVRSPQSPGNSAESTCHASTGTLFSKERRSRKSSAGPSGTAQCSQTATEVLVVYTPDAADGRDINGIINTAIQETNDAYNNSDAYNTDVTLAHSQQVAINGIGIGGIDDDLGELQSSGTVQSLRDQHDADVVVLLTADIYGATKGKVDEVRAEAEDAYAIVAASYATGGAFVFPHEVGHLQGAQHRPVNACAPGTTCDEEGELFPDAFAREFEGDDSPWCLWLCGDTDYGTITALPDRSYTRVKHFSNPNVNHDGGQTGTNSNNNTDALTTTANTVEDFRISNELRARFSITTSDPLGSERTFTANPCGATGSYSYEWRISYNGSGNYGTVVSSQKSFSETFPEGTHYVKLTVTSGSQSDTAIQVFYISGECDGRDPCRKTVNSTTKGADDKTAPAKQRAGGSDPTQVALHAPTPNPVASTTQISYALPERTEVALAVYDLMGRQVATLVTGTRSVGTHRVRLDGTSLTSGTYVVRLRAGDRQKTRRITVVK